MINWEDFLAYMDSSEPALKAWGHHVVSTVNGKAQRIFNDKSALQISSYRVKDKSSAIGKIARKNYTNPKSQMTDLVGARIVVLLSSQLPTVSKIIEECTEWEARVDRDPKEEVFNNPNLFDYQSKHYILQAKKSIGKINGIDIPEGLPCEVQVRTILQHAFAEVVHDKIYKSEGIVPIDAKRHCASSMALMETADHLLCETMHKIDEINKPTDSTLQDLISVYESLFGSMDDFFDLKLNSYIVDNLSGSISNEIKADISKIIRDNKEIPNKINDRRSRNNPFWSQPISLLAYWYVTNNERDALYEWPIASFREDIQLVYSDLGIATP